MAEAWGPQVVVQPIRSAVGYAGGDRSWDRSHEELGDGEQALKLRRYQACAKEFHQTGNVRCSLESAGYRRTTARMGVILLTLVFCASLATGITPLSILSLMALQELDSMAQQLAMQVSGLVTLQLATMTNVVPTMVEQTGQMFATGVLDSNLEDGFESLASHLLFRYLYVNLYGFRDAHVPYLYVSTEYSADFTIQNVNVTHFFLWNRTWPPLLAKYPNGPVPAPGSLGIPDEDCWEDLGGDRIGNLTGFSAVFDPRTRPWYIAAKAGGPDYRGWTTPYLFFDHITLGVTASRPLYNLTGHFFGVVGADITLGGLVAYLNSAAMRLTPNMRHAVIELTGDIIGCNVPGVVTAAVVNDTATRVGITDPRQPREVLQAIATLQGGRPGFNLSTDGEVLRKNGYYYYATFLQDEYNLQWVYVMYVPVDDFLGTATTTVEAAICICVALVFLIMVMSLIGVWSFGLQLRRLVVDMRRATSLQLSEIHTDRTGIYITELRDIGVEFDKLVNALRSFQKYLPQDQVGFLLRSNLEAGIAAVHQKITILFLDIVNFTTAIEALSDADTLRYYGDVMTTLTDRIKGGDGTLDKYIGDAVMAFWNMPRAVADHETKAVRAALACRAAIPMLADRGWTVDFRSGINTAVCQVGNFGSWDRLNYTAIGDGVNVASRLEALCKAYHCPILISETTHKGLALDTFVTRLVDKVAVKGKDMITVLHQVVGYPEDVLPSALPGLLDYEKAFTLYCSGSYSAAQQAWRKLGMLGDQTAQMMADRLENDRPTSGGVWKWNTK